MFIVLGVCQWLNYTKGVVYFSAIFICLSISPRTKLMLNAGGYLVDTSSNAYINSKLYCITAFSCPHD